MNADKNKIQVLYFNYKTHMNDVYKLKKLKNRCCRPLF